MSEEQAAASEEAKAPSPPPKVDPETLAIRARPPRAIRFRREVIIAGAAAGAAALVAVAWIALEPRIVRQAAQQSELSQPGARPANEVAQGLPDNYAGVPRLGPPLPGDLGRPILRARQREMAAQEGYPGSAVEAAMPERQRKAAELRAARESALLVQSGRPPAAGPAARDAVALPAPRVPELAPADAGSGSHGQDHKAKFVASLDDGGDINPHRLSGPASPNSLVAGSVIAASLLTGLNSDLPGMVIAQVTQNAYDTATGQVLLVPQGARLVGKYDSAVAFGQRRALVVWQRLILPDGRSMRLDNMPAADPSGYAGLADKVDFYTWRLLKGAAISTLLGVGAQLSVSGESDLVEAIREAAQTNIARAGDQLAQHNLNIPPTVTIRPGTPVRLIVRRDLVFPPRVHKEPDHVRP
ncbi:conjugal transfer protein TrbI [Novosphingobium endophyticum]|uniref:Conjugal transfer protein TrbI n=1 Tax=Novosphingobium endophyticum TaxID=1955250 RepID=A0A916TTG0_9SPHN|nr:TrbI/VirB10 family protein [Novosphingobium endophyticum]GGC04640.1 conjugal transfer protein TrbI [Novosphingobium endophyticum]